jgi:hypothetical protein
VVVSQPGPLKSGLQWVFGAGQQQNAEQARKARSAQFEQNNAQMRQIQENLNRGTVTQAEAQAQADLIRLPAQQAQAGAVSDLSNRNADLQVDRTLQLNTGLTGNATTLQNNQTDNQLRVQDGMVRGTQDITRTAGEVQGQLKGQEIEGFGKNALSIIGATGDQQMNIHRGFFGDQPVLGQLLGHDAATQERMLGFQREMSAQERPFRMAGTAIQGAAALGLLFS